MLRLYLLKKLAKMMRLSHVETAYVSSKPDKWHIFFEVKPKIYSVGSVIRQCEALMYAAARSGNRHCDVVPIVYRDDPSADLLRELCPGNGDLGQASVVNLFPSISATM